MTETERLILKTLRDAGVPLFNGTLGVLANIKWNDKAIKSAETKGWIEGHPLTLTDAGRLALEQNEKEG